jgi:hypothetical protein
MNSSPVQIAGTTPTPEPSSYSVYQIIGVIIIFTIFASVVSYSRNILSVDGLSWLSDKVKSMNPFNKSDPVGIEHNHSGAALQYPNNDKPMSKELKELVKDTKQESKELQKEEEKKHVPIASAKEPPPAASAEQTWCFIGDDIAGRWCIQVHDEKSCDNNRAYKSKNACERGQ